MSTTHAIERANLLAWLDAARAAYPLCTNPDDLDVLILTQATRLEILESDLSDQWSRGNNETGV